MGIGAEAGRKGARHKGRLGERLAKHGSVASKQKLVLSYLAIGPAVRHFETPVPYLTGDPF